LGFNFEFQIQVYLDHLDNFITILFLVELIVKLRVYGKTRYFESGWNIFDFVLVLLALPSLMDEFLPYDFIDLNFLLAFRILRVFKFFRFIRFIPNIGRILNGATRAIKSSLLILIGFVLINFIIGIVACFMFRNISPDYFSNPIESIYSIFKIFTVEGWYEIPDSITSNIENPILIQLVRLFFIMILFTGGIFGLSLVNSIFVDAMVSDNNDDLTQQVNKLEEKIDKLISQNLEK
jgi:voltage-gated sodium channel